MVSHGQSDSSSSLIGRNKVYPSLGKALLILLDKFTRQRNSLVRKDLSVFIAGNSEFLVRFQLSFELQQLGSFKIMLNNSTLLPYKMDNKLFCLKKIFPTNTK